MPSVWYMVNWQKWREASHKQQLVNSNETNQINIHIGTVKKHWKSFEEHLNIRKCMQKK